MKGVLLLYLLLLLQQQWYPELKALVNRVKERFSATFERIHCAGEVHIEEHEDYAQWSIQILVKFPSSEELQRLTGQQQSGGVSRISRFSRCIQWHLLQGAFVDDYSVPYEALVL